MFGLGTIVNTIAVVVGGIIGLLLKNGLKNRYQETIMQGIGLAVLFVGISGAMTGMLKISKSIIESTGSLILVLSLCFGALIGEFINIEKRIEQFGFYLKSKVKSNDSKFIEGFVSTSLVICVGAMAIVGSFQDGLLHDPSILISKAVMDFVIVMVFASTLKKTRTSSRNRSLMRLFMRPRTLF